MDRRTRICLWVIVIGLANFVAYTISYMVIGGDAPNGRVAAQTVGSHLERYYFLGPSGAESKVSQGVWVYSAIHSISVWLTVAAVMLAMLTLAKDRIVSSMRSTVMRGRTFITILATLITFITVVITIYFVIQTIRKLSHPELLPAAMAWMYS